MKAFLLHYFQMVSRFLVKDNELLPQVDFNSLSKFVGRKMLGTKKNKNNCQSFADISKCHLRALRGFFKNSALTKHK